MIVGVGVLAVALLYRRIQSIGAITVSLWAGTLLTVAVVVVTGAFHFRPSVAFDFPPGAFDFSLGYLVGLGAASRFGIYDYLGYYDVCFIGDEVREPGRVIPRSILYSIFGCAVAYAPIGIGGGVQLIFPLDRLPIFSRYAYRLEYPATSIYQMPADCPVG